MKRFAILCALALASCSSAPVAPTPVAQVDEDSFEKVTVRSPAQVCGTIAHAPKFVLDERLFTWGTKLDIKLPKGSLGSVEQKVFSWGMSFKMFDSQKTLVASAKQKVFSWGSHIELFDCNGNKFGSIKENVAKSWTKISTSYELLDAHDQKIGASNGRNFLETNFEIVDNQGRRVARLHRGWLNWLGDKWQVETFDRHFDSRMFMFIGAYKTAVDNARAAESSDSSSSSSSR
ncbi:MAG: hypothetical protein AAB250_13155 [Bdellovibrionota bacterium]